MDSKMNRHQRRRAGSIKSAPLSSAAGIVPEQPFFVEKAASTAAPPTARPRLLVRLFAAVVLSGPVRRRIHHPAARAALALVAREVGRHDLAAELDS